MASKPLAARNPLLDLLGKYKEVLTFVALAVTLAVAFINFFATKKELTILRCEVDLGKIFLGNRLDEEKYLKDIVTLRKRLDEAKKSLGANAEASDSVLELNLQLEAAKDSWTQARARYGDAAQKLETQTCRQRGEKP